MAGPPAYPIPQGLHATPSHLLDLRPDSEIDASIISAPSVVSEKNVWFFWHSGFTNMHPYTARNIRAWHRRLSPLGWTIRVLDRVPSSASNIANFLSVNDPDVFPAAFRDGRIGGDYAPQHTSDLVRFPLLLKHGGVYADVGLLQIGDLDRLWNETVANSESPYEVLSYNVGTETQYNLANYFLCARPSNPLFERCHKLFLALWNEDGGKVDTDGMSLSPLLKGVPPFPGQITFEEDGKVYGPEEVARMLADYIAQGAAINMCMGLVDEEDGWNGPKYTVEHVYAIEYMEGSQMINQMTNWNGQKAYELMSLQLPKNGEKENGDQKSAKEIVEACLKKSFGFKLAHGLIIRVYGQTLGSLWRRHTGSDDVPGTYAHWLRYGMVYWNQDNLPERVELQQLAPFKIGRLLG